VQGRRVHRRHDGVVEVDAESHGRRAGQGREPLHDLAEQRRERGRHRHHAHHPALGTREVQHVFHQVGQAARLLDDDRERLPPLVLSGRPAQLERLAEEQDLGERCAQLVRDAGGEVVPEPHQLVLAPELPRGDRCEPRGERQQTEQQREPRAGTRHHELTGDAWRERRAHEDRPRLRCRIARIGARRGGRA
jgi:hypothetical protein